MSRPFYRVTLLKIRYCSALGAVSSHITISSEPMYKQLAGATKMAIDENGSKSLLRSEALILSQYYCTYYLIVNSRGSI